MPAARKMSAVGDTMASAHDSGSESDDAPPEETSNVQSRSALRATDEERKALRKREQDVRRKRAVQRQEQSQDAKERRRAATATVATAAAAAAASASESKKGDNDKRQRLDPALFAASFAQPAPGTRASSSSSSSSLALEKAAQTDSKTSNKLDALRRAAEQRRKEKRAGGIVQGRDGQPMRSVQDGRTIVRVLPRSSTGQGTKEGDKGPEDVKEETLITSNGAAFDKSQYLPSSKASKFKKRKLGLTNAFAPNDERRTTTNGKKAKKSARSAEDPLGLEDPAFMQGGEMAHLVAKGKKSPSAFKATGRAAKGPSTNRRGDAGRRSMRQNSSTTRQAVPSQFARPRV